MANMTEDEKLMNQDLELFGVAFGRKREDGTTQRVYPLEVRRVDGGWVWDSPSGPIKIALSKWLAHVDPATASRQLRTAEPPKSPAVTREELVNRVVAATAAWSRTHEVGENSPEQESEAWSELYSARRELVEHDRKAHESKCYSCRQGRHRNAT